MDCSAQSSAVTLADGRKLGFARYGPCSNSVVFYFHGSAGSRLERPPRLSILHDLGIQFISVDRPGHGLSGPHPNRSLPGWAEDVRQLASHLRVDRFHVMGLSAGGPHALACASRLRERTVACAVVSGPAPPDRPHPYRDLPAVHRVILFAFRNIPRLVYTMRRGAYSLAHGDTDVLREKLAASFPSADRQLLGIPWNMEMMIEDIREGYRQGWIGPACDDILINSPWAFRLQDLHVRVDVWHGALDRNIPLDQAAFLHEQIPNSRLMTWQDQGHLGLLAKWREVLESLVDSGSG